MIAFITDNMTAEDGSTKRQRELNSARRLLDRLLGERLEIGHDSDGRPFVVGRSENISISHSATRIAVAVSDSVPIGIDVEDNAAKAAIVLSRVMTPEEAECPGTVDPLVRWMVKEAVVKASCVPGMLVSEVEVRADSTAVVRKSEYSWLSLPGGVVVAVHSTAKNELMQCQRMSY